MAGFVRQKGIFEGDVMVGGVEFHRLAQCLETVHRDIEASARKYVGYRESFGIDGVLSGIL